jgi:predicted PurR-regulated permease PerM
MADPDSAAPDMPVLDPLSAERVARRQRPDFSPGPPSERSGALLSLLAMAPGLRWMIGSVIAALVIAALFFGREILMPLALAFLLGFVLDPMVTRLKRWGLPRAVAVITVVSATLILLGAGGYLVGMQARALSAELPTYQQNIQQKLRGLRSHISGPGVLDGLFKTMNTVQKEVESPLQGAGTSANAPRAGSAAAGPVQRVQIEETPASPFKTAMEWLEAASGPLATAGIVLVFVFLVLLDRQDLRDRLVRLMGGSLHRSTDAMDEAGERIGKYLRMQLLVNVSYGVPMALGLWLIGVPGALLWGALAAIMRFVPYVGPMISALFPLALAFAIDPGWNLVLLTVGLIVVLELISNNVVEPLLYGSSTGLSAMSLMVSATFWTALWGPIGLIMATPLTVCLLVVGRYLPALQFLDVLLGSQPALDPPTRFYQRLLAGDTDEALELASESVERSGSIVVFYEEVAIPALRLAVDAHGSAASAEHRLRLVDGMESVLEDLQEQHPANPTQGPEKIVCLGGKWEVDAMAARMLAHSISLSGLQADVHLPMGNDLLDGLDLKGVDAVCVSYFSTEPQKAARVLVRRLKRRWPHVQALLVLWNAPDVVRDYQAQADAADAAKASGAPDAPRVGAAAVGSVADAVAQIRGMLGASDVGGYEMATAPDDDAQRVAALRASGALQSEPMQRIFGAAAKRAADVFDVPFAMVSLVDETRQWVRASHGSLGPQADGKSSDISGDGGDAGQAREQTLCGHVVSTGKSLTVADVLRDPRFAGNPLLREQGIRFYAASPLADAQGNVWGTLCLMDGEPHEFDAKEQRLLRAMARDVMETIQGAEGRDGVEGGEDAGNAIAANSEKLRVLPEDEAPPSATVGQVVPG